MSALPQIATPIGALEFRGRLVDQRRTVSRRHRLMRFRVFNVLTLEMTARHVRYVVRHQNHFCTATCTAAFSRVRLRLLSDCFGRVFLVGVAGFEPATPTSRTWCATRLRYTPTEGRTYNPGVPKRKLERGNDCRARNARIQGRYRGD